MTKGLCVRDLCGRCLYCDLCNAGDIARIVSFSAHDYLIAVFSGTATPALADTGHVRGSLIEYFASHHSARNASFRPIFVPSSYVLPE